MMSFASVENEFYAQASVVYEDGSCRESYAAFTDDEPTAGTAESLTPKKAALAKKNADLLKFNNGNLLLGMSGAKTTSVQVPTLNGSIMGSAGNNPGDSYIGPATKNARPITALESLQIDRKNAPGEYKLDYIFKAFGTWLGSGKNCFTTMALADGMQPEYANLYGDFTMGMGFETLGTVSISGLKSVSGLSKGFISGDDIIVGSGFGNTAKGSGKTLLPGEGKVGTYEDLIDAGSRGDNITPHHMPSAKYMETNVGVPKNDGVSMNMEQPYPGKGGRHRLTDTYGMTGEKLQDYLNLSPRDVLAHDIKDARNIYQNDNLYTLDIRQGLQDVIKMNKELHPDLYKK